MAIRIGGLLKQSLIDYPGKISAVLFLTGCNFRCPYCHNASLIAGDAPQCISWDDALAFLASRSNFLDGVVISGGEPTLQSDLPDLCQSIRSMGLSVKLDTNGSRPSMVAHLIENRFVDTVALDIKTVPSMYAQFGGVLGGTAAGDGVRECIDRLTGAQMDFECRTTCAAPFISENLIEGLVREIQSANRWVLQPYRQDSVLDAEFLTAHAPHPDTDALKQYQRMATDAGLSCTIR